MHSPTPIPRTLQPVLSLLLLALALFLGASTCLPAADSASKPATTPEEKTPKKAPKKKLSGADLYAIHCNRCHPERYATERTAAQWKTIMVHMRVRAYLPADQAKAILKYLQEDSGK